MLIFCSLSQEHFQSKCSRERQQNISILTILHLLGIVGIVSVRSKSLSTSLKKMKLTDIGLQYQFSRSIYLSRVLNICNQNISVD